MERGQRDTLALMSHFLPRHFSSETSTCSCVRKECIQFCNFSWAEERRLSRSPCEKTVRQRGEEIIEIDSVEKIPMKMRSMAEVCLDSFQLALEIQRKVRPRIRACRDRYMSVMQRSEKLPYRIQSDERSFRRQSYMEFILARCMLQQRTKIPIILGTKTYCRMRMDIHICLEIPWYLFQCNKSENILPDVLSR